MPMSGERIRLPDIPPQTGRVIGWIDLRGLVSEGDRSELVDVLDGIAYDSEADRLFVTGKLWPKVFEIELAPVEWLPIAQVAPTLLPG